MSTDDIKRIKVWVTDKGKTPSDNNLAIDKSITKDDLNQSFDFDVWADWIADGAEKKKVTDLTFRYGAQPPPPPGEIETIIEYSPLKVDIGTLVTVNGAKTKPSSPNASITSWQWIVTNEGGMSYPVTDADKPLATFTTPDLNWMYVTLKVQDSNGKQGVAKIMIDIGEPQPDNKPPIAVAGPDQTVAPKTTVTLSGSQSYDPDNDPISYQWTQVSGKQVLLSSPTSAVTTFIAPDLDTPPPPEEPKAILLAPSQVKPFDNVTLDASQSIADVLDVKLITTGVNIDLNEIAKWKWNFIAPDGNFQLQFQATATKGTKQAITQVAIQVSKQPTEGEIDKFGIKWLVGKGSQYLVKMSRDTDDDDRWSGNVNGLANFVELTMIGKSIGMASDGHFACKLFGGNHSGSGASSQRWYDFGLRKNGNVQLQWEGPHPDNHTFTLPESKQFIKNIGDIENRNIGLKWIINKVKVGGSPADGGVRCRMYIDRDALGADGKPKNNWELAFDFIDGVDVEVIDPQDYEAPDEQDCEVRRSGTQDHEIHGGGLHVRALGSGQAMTQEEYDRLKVSRRGGLFKKGPMKVTTDEQVEDCDASTEEEIRNTVERVDNTQNNNNDDQRRTFQPETETARAAAAPIDLSFRLTVTDSKNATSSDDVKVTVSELPPPPDDPVARLVAPSQVVSGSTVVLDASGSTNYDNLTIIQTVGETVQLTPLTGSRWQFMAPTASSSNFQLGFQLTATKGPKQSTAQVTIQVVTVPPPPPSFKIGHIGDSHGRTKGVSGFKELKQKHNCEFILHSGDTTDDENDASHFVDLVKEMGLTYGTSFAESQGNHESPEESGQGAQEDLENAFPTLKQTKWLQFYHHKNVVIIINNTQLPNYSQLSSESSKHMQASLVKAKQLVDSGQADWIFIMQHKPMYIIANDGHEAEYNFRYVFHPLIDQYGGDFFLSGHVHLAHRTLPLIFGGDGTNVPPKVNSAMKGDAHDFTVKPHGIICAHNGSSSKEHSKDEDTNPWTGYVEDGVDAYTVFEIAGKTVTGRYIEIGTDKVLHEFKVTKEGSIPPPPPPTCNPGEHWDPIQQKCVPDTPTNTAFRFNTSGDFRDTPESADNLVSDKPDLIVLTGDYGIAQDPQDWVDEIFKVVKDSGIPVYGALGNHDDEDDYLKVGLFKNTSWSWSHKKGSVCFVAANTIDENVAETDKLLAEAQADPNIKTIIVLMHEGIWHPQGTSVSSDTTIEFHNSFIKYKKTKLVLCGHTHVYGRMIVKDGILYVMNGVGGQSPSSGSTTPNTFHKINGALHCTVATDGSIKCQSVPNKGDAPNIMDTFEIKADGSLPTDGTPIRPRDGD